MLRQLFHYSIHCLKQASHEIEIENWKHSRLDLIIFRKANIICFVYIEFFTRSTEGIENFQISRFEYKSTCTQCLSLRRSVLSLLKSHRRLLLAGQRAGPVKAGSLLGGLRGGEQHLGGAGGRGQHDPRLQGLPQTREDGKCLFKYRTSGLSCCCQISWLRHTVLTSPDLLTVGNITYTGDPRISSSYSYPNNWRLVVTDVTSLDTGLYVCQISTHPPKELHTRVLVKGENPASFIWCTGKLSLCPLSTSWENYYLSSLEMEMNLLTWFGPSF